MTQEEFARQYDYLLDLLEQTDDPWQISDIKNRICSLRKEYFSNNNKKEMK